MRPIIPFACLSAVLLIGSAANGQSGLRVSSSVGSVGSRCEPFDCSPHFTLASCGETVKFEVVGPLEGAYAFFMGCPVTACQPYGGFVGQLALFAPIITLDVGFLPALDPMVPRHGQPVSECDLLPSAFVTEKIPLWIPPGMDIRFQALVVDLSGNGNMPEFTRAVEVRCR